MTGSTGFYLKNLFTEPLAGRKYIFELYPLNFREFLLFKDRSIKIPEGSGNFTRLVFDMIAPLYDEYIMYGGFPGVEEKRRALEDIFSSFFQLEILQLGDFRRNDVIRELMLLLMRRTGSKLGIKRISIDFGVSHQTLYEYISLLEGTCFIKTIKPFIRGRSSEIRKMPKEYVCETRLANHLASLDMGRLFIRFFRV